MFKKSKQLTVDSLRSKHPVFHYDRFSCRITKGGLEIKYFYRTEPNLMFVSQVIIGGINNKQTNKTGKENLDNLVFHLGLVEMINYWKATCSPEIQIHCGFLDNNQKSWWKSLIINGMGQYFYTNSIDFTKNGFLSIKIDSPSSRINKKTFNIVDNRILVPVSGGKDSIVTLELLKQSKNKLNITGFVLNGNSSARAIFKKAKIKKIIFCQRKIDPRLLRLNKAGYLNGHVPFSAFLAFLAYLTASLTGNRYIAFSNERSANEGNAEYLKHQINHQWSKTYAFENRFRNYAHSYLYPKIDYFSFLRPLYELQIAKIFSRFPQYFNSFVSCNKKSTISQKNKSTAGKWCGECSKCLFAQAILFPFVKASLIIKIFGKDLFKDRALLPTMNELIDPKTIKPFECVGTKAEARVAFYLCLNAAGKDLPILLQIYKKNYLKKYPNIDAESKRLINSWDNNNNLPKQFIKLIN